MVAISFTEPEKEGQVQEEHPVQGQGQIQGQAPLLPCTLKEARSRGRESDRAGNRGCLVLVLLSVIFAVLTVKKICDLKEENMRLWEQLSLERQKDSVLKMALRDNIPSTRFLAHQFTAAEVALVEADGRVEATSGSRWTINLSVLWASPLITPCDMHALSHVLAEEIYSKGAELSAAEEQKEQEELELQEEQEKLEEQEEQELSLPEMVNTVLMVPRDEDVTSAEEDEELKELLEDLEWEEADKLVALDMGSQEYDYLGNVAGDYDDLDLDEDEGSSEEEGSVEQGEDYTDYYPGEEYYYDSEAFYKSEAY